jgi:hypothetical protein
VVFKTQMLVFYKSKTNYNDGNSLRASFTTTVWKRIGGTSVNCTSRVIIMKIG